MKITGVEQLIDLIDRILEGRGLSQEERDEIFEDPDNLDQLAAAIDRGFFTYAVVMELTDKLSPTQVKRKMAYASDYEDEYEELDEAFKNMPAKSEKEILKNYFDNDGERYYQFERFITQMVVDMLYKGFNVNDNKNRIIEGFMDWTKIAVEVGLEEVNNLMIEKEWRKKNKKTPTIDDPADLPF